MATRRPLVLVIGKIKELPAGDTILGGGGSAPVIKQVTLDIPIATYVTEIGIIDAEVSATSIIRANFVPSMDSENDIEHIIDNGIKLFGIPETGQIRFIMAANAPFVGPFPVNYEVI